MPVLAHYANLISCQSWPVTPVEFHASISLLCQLFVSVMLYYPALLSCQNQKRGPGHLELSVYSDYVSPLINNMSTST